MAPMNNCIGYLGLLWKCVLLSTHAKKPKSDSSDTGVKKNVGEGLAPGLNDSFMAVCSSP